MSIDLRLGRWQDALSDVERVDALIVDAPYSERTHSGHDDGTAAANRAEVGRVNSTTGQVERGWQRAAVPYVRWTDVDVRSFVESWSGRVSGWFVSVTDHILSVAWADALSMAGRYVFAPLPLVETGSRVRLSGDGPSSWTCWVVVARPANRAFQHWGTLPGAYVGPAEKKPVVGGKPLGLMRAIVRDYSRPGDLIVDPCAGGGTTLLAAAMEGRRAVGAEMDPKHYEIARKRIGRGYTPTMFAE